MAIQYSSTTTKRRMTYSNLDLLALKQPHLHHRLCLVHLGAPPGVSSVTLQWTFFLYNIFFLDMEVYAAGEHPNRSFSHVPPFRIPFESLKTH